MNNTKYKPEYCDQLKKHMAEGLSFKSFSAVVGVAPSTLFDWLEAYPEFSEAKEIGTNASLLFWERLSINSAMGNLVGDRPANIIAIIWNMKNRFKEDWQDKQVVESSNSDSLKITMAYPELLPPPGTAIIEATSRPLLPSKDDPIKKETEENEDNSGS